MISNPIDIKRHCMVEIYSRTKQDPVGSDVVEDTFDNSPMEIIDECMN